VDISGESRPIELDMSSSAGAGSEINEERERAREACSGHESRQ